MKAPDAERLPPVVVGLIGLRTEAGGGGQGSAQAEGEIGVARSLVHQAGSRGRIGPVGVEIVGRVGPREESRVELLTGPRQAASGFPHSGCSSTWFRLMNACVPASQHQRRERIRRDRCTPPRPAPQSPGGGVSETTPPALTVTGTQQPSGTLSGSVTTI